MTEIVGREAELGALRELVGSIVDRAAALVLEGEAGMGKTTLWTAGVQEAEARSLHVLRALPAESESALSFAGVGDLLDPVLDHALDPLPAGQKRALSLALVLEDAEGPPPDPHAVGVALLNAIRALSEARPLLVAVDDVQWLDTASAAALAYAARRLRGEHVGVLLSRRSGLDSPLLSELRRSLPADRCTSVEVGPLDAGALHHVVQEHLGIVLPRPLLAEVHQASGGNPFYALEIVRMLKRTDLSVEAGQPLPVPESLHELVDERLLALPAESRDFLLAAAAHAHPTVSITEAATGVARSVGLAPALEARIVEVDGERIRFTHPLLAAGAYETADPLRRVEVHVRLAELLDDPEARAWQLSASIDDPDGAVASVLEEAAQHARARGAPRPAALLLDRAQELTPADLYEDGVRRAVDAAFLHFEAGDSPRAEAQLRDLIAPLAHGRERAQALNLLARIRTYAAPGEALELFRQVIAEAEGDEETLAVAHEGVASSLIWLFESFDEIVQHADVAFGLALELGDDALAGDAVLGKVFAEALLGRSTLRGTVDTALALQEVTTRRRVLDQPLVALAEYWTWIDMPQRSLDTLRGLLERATELGDENSTSWLLTLCAQAELGLGRLADALADSREAVTLAEQSGQPLFAGLGLAVGSLVLAQLGRPEEAREAAERAFELARGTSAEADLVASSALGHLELARNAAGSAEAHLKPAVEFARLENIAESGAIRFVVDQIEALIELGRRDEAIELLDWYERNARRLERVSALANCARCRGLLAAQSGDLDSALSAYEDALAWHAQVQLPLDRGRTLLALGAAQRRLKRRREARTTFEEALAVFERMGAALWAERARAELKRISGRAATPGALTPAEERVAGLVAEGKTNKEVATALFLSERTVEGHLSRIFGKLGIKHRAELGPALASRQTQGVAAPNMGDSPVSSESLAP
jgi:DNA-binding CsgD family transcriptional regulator